MQLNLSTPEGVVNAAHAVLSLVAEHHLPEPREMHAVARLGYLSVELPDRDALTLWTADTDVRVIAGFDQTEVHGTCPLEAWAFIPDGAHPDGLHVCLWYCASPAPVVECQLCEGAGWQAVYSTAGGTGVRVEHVDCACQRRAVAA